MIKYLIPFFLLSILISCKTEPNHSNIDASENTSTHLDTIQMMDTMPAIEEVNFVFIEDYATLKTKEEIIAAFGKKNSVDGNSWYAEGTVQLKHTIVTNPKNQQIIKYVWDEDQPSKLNSIEVCYFDWTENFEVRKTQKVESKSGIFTGMPINLLRDWNQADFTFSGFGWDYEGGIFVKEGSKLAKNNIRIKLGLIYEGAGNDLNSIMGDIELSTNNPIVKKAPIIVERLYYNFE